MSTFHYLPTEPDSNGHCGFIRKNKNNMSSNELEFLNKTKGLSHKNPDDKEKYRALAKELLWSKKGNQ